ncbi:MAG: aminopeptidase P family N-terminal domain-containing protein [Deferrisomatales bacterium]|nr:aminopeptidase P family N-terminal domain-containing protein [Deferrisomatales bacterium]
MTEDGCTLTVPEGEIRARITALQTRLRERGLRGALVTGTVDRFYLSGTGQDGLLWAEDGTLVVS